MPRHPRSVRFHSQPQNRSISYSTYYNLCDGRLICYNHSMSGVLRYHDITYRIMGQILSLGVKSVVWSFKTLATAVTASLDDETRNLVEENGKDTTTEVRRLIYYSKNRGYLNAKLQTTKLGADKLARLNFREIPMTEAWDGKWRLVMYDIPEENRASRNQVRRLIKQLGFIQLQQSVWAHPLPCLSEFETIREANGLGNALVLIETEEITGVGKYKSHFLRLYPELKL